MTEDRLERIEDKIDKQGDMISDVSRDVAVIKANQDSDREANHKEHGEIREYIVDKNRDQDRRIKETSDRLHVFEMALHELTENFGKFKSSIEKMIEKTKGRVEGISFPIKRIWELLLVAIGGGVLLKLIEHFMKNQ